MAICILILFKAELSYSYLLCLGREEVFRWISNLFWNNVLFFSRYDQTDFYASPGPSGYEFKGPLWHPVRLFPNLVTWNMFILAPIFYCAIFKFRKSQDLTPGTYTTRILRFHSFVISRWTGLIIIYNFGRYQWDWKEEKEGEQPLHHQNQFHCLAARGSHLEISCTKIAGSKYFHIWKCILKFTQKFKPSAPIWRSRGTRSPQSCWEIPFYLADFLCPFQALLDHYCRQVGLLSSLFPSPYLNLPGSVLGFCSCEIQWKILKKLNKNNFRGGRRWLVQIPKFARNYFKAL